MNTPKGLFLCIFVGAATVYSTGVTTVGAADPLPSWNECASKESIVLFVERITKKDSPDFVPVAERIATFDNDGYDRDSHIGKLDHGLEEAKR